MAYKNKIIYNPKTGQQIKFVQTAKTTRGELLEMITTYQALSTGPVEHYHPVQREVFTMLEGQLNVKINGLEQVLKAGDVLHVPANARHAMWNNGTTKAVVNWKVTPALDTEYFLETSMGLAADNKTNNRGMPPLLQVAVMAHRFSRVFRMSKPPFFIQYTLFVLLKPFAWLAGYKPIYREYVD